MPAAAKILRPSQFQLENIADARSEKPNPDLLNVLNRADSTPLDTRNTQHNTPAIHKRIDLPSRSDTPSNKNGSTANKATEIDQKITRLESQLENLLIHHQRPSFTPTLLIALLILLSSLILAFVYHTTSKVDPNALELSLIRTISQTENPQQKQSSLSLLSKVTDNKVIRAWASALMDGSQNIAKGYRWPLERQRYLKTQIDYEPYKRGVNISAKLGDPIIAIRDGTVVYSGQGIAGYGNLILIQHDNELISVYGNNYSNYVKEGVKIKQGQLIAAVGESTGNKPALYFEIRYKGEPEDPFLYFGH